MDHPQGAAGYRIEAPQGVIVYASDLEPGDTKLDRVVREASKGARTLIYDSQFKPDDYPAHKGTVARDARVHQLVLFHHDPFHDDHALARIEADTQAQFENSLAAREGWFAEYSCAAKSQYPSSA
jgi:phosphoribosyl 1,2-cyclic phosphodiesterase